MERQRAQQRHVAGRRSVTCSSIPNGPNVTIACSDGYWRTTTPNGKVYTGTGTFDPNASARGSGIVIDQLLHHVAPDHAERGRRHVLAPRGPHYQNQF